jgi:hypothetical protein
LTAIGIVLIPKKLVPTKTPCTTWLVASSGKVGIAASAAVYADAAVSCCAAAVALSALACVSQARYGTNATTNSSALGPCHAPVCTSDSTVLSSSAISVYSALSKSHAPAAVSNEPGPGPLLNIVECTSGGAAIQTGAVIVSSPERDMPPRPPRHGWCS